MILRSSPETSPRTVNAAPSALTCREIDPNDLDSVLDCLQRGFPDRGRDYWARGLERLSRRDPPAGWPRYGQALFVEGKAVGALLQIVSQRGEGADARVVCNLSSWCLDEAYRAYAFLLHRRATARKEAVFLNISAAPHTRAAIEADGFLRYADGQMFFAPLLSRASRSARALPYAKSATAAERLPPGERRLLEEHAALGCHALVGVDGDETTAFVLQDRTVWKRLVPGAHVVYARSEADLLRFAGALGRYLARRGRPFLAVDANAAIPGLVGRYAGDREPRYARGPMAHSPLDLAYTELQIFGR